MTAIVPYGWWPSPLTSEQAAAGKVGLSDLCSDGRFLYWLESRPSDGGRVAFVRQESGSDGIGDSVVELSPPEVSIRSRVHEYGGGAVCLVPGYGDGAFAYVALADQRVWCIHGPGGTPVPLSPEAPAGQRWHHGGLGASADGQWVVAVREIHTEVAEDAGTAGSAGSAGSVPTAEASPPRRCVVALGTRPETFGQSILLEGHDFYGAPKMDPRGDRIAAVVWDHPDMPWDRSAVEVVALDRQTNTDTGRARLVATGSPRTVGGGEDESTGQPMWSGHGDLYFVSDRAGWWQPYILGDGEGDRKGGPQGPPIPVTDTAAEFHGPDFVLGLCTMAELHDGTLMARMTSVGRDSMVAFRATADATGTTTGHPPRVIAQPCVAISSVCAHQDGVAFIGATPDAPVRVWALPSLDHDPRPVGPDRHTALGAEDISVGEPFAGTGRSGRPVFGVLYLPTLVGTAGPPGDLPPLVVHCHSGPTSATQASFDLTVQFFTSRGFAVAGVDYAGSTGYGRAYRCSLWGQWGVADSEDCVDAALHLAALGRVDGARMAIRGGSAGGLTALNALTAGAGFAAAASWYGVTDLLALAASTHDFEAHYLDRLIGALPEYRAAYESRSPVHRATEMQGSVLLLQGLDDPVVPSAQAERLRQALSAAGRPCEAHFFAGEGHGFRQSATLVECLDAELDFYRRQLHL